MVRLIADAETRIAELLAGSVDFAWGFSQEQAENLKTAPPLVVRQGKSPNIFLLNLDSTNRSTHAEPLKDVRVRRAIAHPINRPALARVIIGGTSEPLVSQCHPIQEFCIQDVTRYAYDPAKARALLAEAGYAKGFKVPMFAVARLLADPVMNDLRAVGITGPLTTPTLADYFRRGANGEFSVMFSGWKLGRALRCGGRDQQLGDRGAVRLSSRPRAHQRLQPGGRRAGQGDPSGEDDHALPANGRAGVLGPARDRLRLLRHEQGSGLHAADRRAALFLSDALAQAVVTADDLP